MGHSFLNPGRKIFFLNGPDIFLQLHVDIKTVASVVAHVYMVDWSCDSITFPEVEFSQSAFCLNQFRKLHIFQYCHEANVIIY